MIDSLVITSIKLDVTEVKPGIGSKVPQAVYTTGGSCSGFLYLQDGSKVDFTAPLSVAEARQVTGAFIAAGRRVYSDLKGGMPESP